MNKNELTKIIKESLISYFYESLNSQKQKYGDELVNKLLSLDPSKTYKYIEQICNYYKEGISEKEIKEYIDKFDILQTKNILKNKNIDYYKNFQDLKNAVDNSNSTTQSQIKRETYDKPYKVIENDKGVWSIYEPQTEQESCLLGKHTVWCTQQIKYRNEFNDYYWGLDFELYYVINKKTQKKYQIVVMQNNVIEEIRDAENIILLPEEFEELTGINPQMFKWDKKLNGKYIIKNTEGNIIEIRNYINNKVNGEYIKYFDNGKIEIKGTYKNNKPDGEYIEYNENGNVIEHALYKNGKMIKDYLDGE